jgi:S-DNA-T family DNA segregation ATPase FtsK/SpoIIIE
MAADKGTKRRPTRGKGKGEQLPMPEPRVPREPGLFDHMVALALGTLWRYKEELLALLLVAAGVLTLLAWVGLAGGAILEPWAAWLDGALGLGAAAVAASLALAGGYILWRELAGWEAVPAVRIIAGEVALFASLALGHLALYGTAAGSPTGERLAGLVGWALAVTLAQPLGIVPAGLFYGLALGLAVAVAGGLSREGVSQALVRLSGRLRRAADGEQSPAGTLAAPAERTPAAGRAQPRAAQARTTAGRAAEPRTNSARATGASAGAEPAGAQAASEPARADGQRAERGRLKGRAKPAERPAAERPAKARARDARLPPLDLLDAGSQAVQNEAELREKEAIIVQTLAHFGLPARVVSMRQGPAVTQFGVEPGFIERPASDGRPRLHKVRVNQIATLANDLALALSATTLRIEAPVPGQSYVGIEVPNKKVNFVSLRSVLEAEAFQRIGSPLAIGLGRDMSGGAVATDLGKMPHLLIAGTTGSGKTVCISTIIAGLIANNTPDDLRLVLIDPKMVELARFNGLPHLAGKVESKLERITGVLRWLAQEMDNRYKLFASVQARHLADYNRKMGRRRDSERLPYVVVVIDELADLMLQSPVETEQTLCRLAQMARATGIHLVLATQRPSTDVVTGLIKANFPARASFAVASSVDSRVILDTTGAETLLGRGDMLFLAPDASAPVRLQGCLVTDREVDRIVDYWKKQHEAELAARAAELTAELRAAEPEAEAVPPAEIPEPPPWEQLIREKQDEQAEEIGDDLIERALEVIHASGHASASLLQRRLRIGYPRAARLMDELEQAGHIGASVAGGRTRAVLRRMERGGADDEDG